jgi:hypothetical protein
MVVLLTNLIPSKFRCSISKIRRKMAGDGVVDMELVK